MGSVLNPGLSSSLVAVQNYSLITLAPQLRFNRPVKLGFSPAKSTHDIEVL